MNKLFVSTSPHITMKNNSTKRIMQDVVLALLPAVIASVFIFGIYPFVVALLSVASCIGAEAIFNAITKKPNSLGDFSAVVTGLILALNLPPVVPLYVPVVGGFFAIMVVKMLFGGIGKNFANPATAGRIFLMLAWTGVMTKFVAPIDLSQGAGELFKYFSPSVVDAVTTATPLASMKVGSLEGISTLNLFLGRVGGSAGEVSSLALLIGGLYLIARRVIDYKIPLVTVFTVGFTTCIFKGKMAFFLPSIFSGGIMLGAFFMATDYSTSPNTNTGKIIFAFGIGFITVLVRELGSMNEGMSFAILFMNIVVPLLDKWIVPKPFGNVRVKKEKKLKSKEAV